MMVQPSELRCTTMASSRILLSILALCCTWSIKPTAVEAFVPPVHPRAQLARASSSSTRGLREGALSSNRAAANGAGGWRTEPTTRRRRSRVGGDDGGVRSLRAGLDLPPLPVGEVVDFVAREIAEQSVRHHWQSGFIGGSVGVVGTLTAIKVGALRACLRSCVCVCGCLCAFCCSCSVCLQLSGSNRVKSITCVPECTLSCIQHLR